MSKLKVYIHLCRSKSRNFKESFTPDSFSQLNSSSAFISSTLKICDELERDKDRFSIAYKNVQDHVKSLNELIEIKHSIALSDVSLS